MRVPDTRLWSLIGSTSIVVLLTLTSAPSVLAQDAPPDGWTMSAELTSVMSMGNSEALTLGAGTSVVNRRGARLLTLEAGGLRTESVTTSRLAVGTPTDFEIRRNEDRQKTAESYFARARYDHAVSDQFFVFGGGDWLRNAFAGIDSRFLIAAGAGNIWMDSDQSRFRTNYAVTYTFQSDVIENPFLNTKFPGVQAGWEYWRRVTDTSEFASRLISDLNLNETDDVRLDFTNSLAVSISSVLALKPSLQVLWRNRPSLTEVPLFAPDGSPLDQTVTTPLAPTDFLFRLALVLNLD